MTDIKQYFRDISQDDLESDMSDFVALLLTEDGYEVITDLEPAVAHGMLLAAADEMADEVCS